MRLTFQESLLAALVGILALAAALAAVDARGATPLPAPLDPRFSMVYMPHHYVTRSAAIGPGPSPQLVGPTHPDFPAPSMCDPMPAFVQVCAWDPKHHVGGQNQCPAGYSLVNKEIPRHC